MFGVFNKAFGLNKIAECEAGEDITIKMIIEDEMEETLQRIALKQKRAPVLDRLLEKQGSNSMITTLFG